MSTDHFTNLVAMADPSVRVAIEDVAPGIRADLMSCGGRQHVLTLTAVVPAHDLLPVAALRRQGIDVAFVGAVHAVVTIPDDSRVVPAMRSIASYGHVYDRDEAAALTPAAVEEVVHALHQRRDRAEQQNAARLARYEAHPTTVAARAQQARERAIQEALPTDEVDAWIVDHLAYSYDQVAAWGRTTRRDRRRLARTLMTGPSAAETGRLLDSIGGHDLRRRVEAHLAR